MVLNYHVEFGAFRLDARERRLTRGGEVVHLEPKVFDLLCVLVGSAGSLVDKQALLDALWPDRVVTENSLTRCVHQLRTALEDDPARPRYVETVAGSGYRFLMPVREVQADNTDVSGNVTPRIGPWITGVAAVAILALVFSFLPDRDDPALANPPVERLAVLPLANLTGDPAQEYFVQGVHDALISELSRVQGIEVISRTSVLRFRDTELGLAEIASELNVDALIEGSVVRDGDRITVVAQLLSARPERHLWSDRFEGDVGGIFDVTGTMAAAIAAQLDQDLEPPGGGKSRAARRVDPVAYDAYLRGRFEFEKRTPRSYQEAEQHFRRAMDLDPDFAPAYVGLAHVLGSAAIFGAVHPANGFPVTRLLAQQALELDPAVADARLLLAGVEFYWNWDWAEAEKLLREQLRKQPDSAHALRILAEVYSVTGRHEEAMTALERARIIEPLSVVSQFKPAHILYLAGNHAAAEELVRSRLEHYPRFWIGLRLLCMARSARGDHEAAVSACREAASASGRAPGALGVLGFVLARAGNREAAIRTIDELESQRAERYVSAGLMAIIQAAVGDTEAAFSHLRQAYEDRDPILIHAEHSDLFRELRGDSRWSEWRARAFPDL